MITVTQNGDVYEVRFPYDPNIVYLVKSVPGRRWNPDNKFWSIPKDKLGFLINAFKGTVYQSMVKILSEENINVNESLSTTAIIPDIDISKIPFYVKEGATPYKHQLDFMKWAIDRQQRGNMSGFIQADSMGLAKTIQSANLALYNKKQYRFNHCLVLCCINSSKYNWKEDIELHTRGEYVPYILGTRKKRGGGVRSDTGGKEKFDDLVSKKMFGKEGDLPYFIVLNVEALRYKVGKFYPISDKIIEYINSGEINMVIVDEVHRNVSPTSQQGKQLLRIKKATGRKAMWIPMTGTPITKQPLDLFVPLKLCDGHGFSSYYAWCNEFCIYGGFGGYEVMGYKNIPKLKKMLEYNMIRRLKSEVLDLPPKIHYTEYVENSEYQKRLYNTVLKDIIAQEDKILMSLNPMTKFLRLRQVNGSPELVDSELKVSDKDYLSKNAKAKRLLELLEEADARGEKTVVFSNWVEPLRTLYRFVSKRYKTCVFTGTMSLEDREKHKHAFMNDPSCKVLLGTIGAAGTSHTFTSARNLIFYDDPWNPSDKEQAEDRIYRIGTTESVNIFTLVSKDTVDDRVEQILSNKDGIAKYIVDNKLDLRNNPDLFNFLLRGDNS